MQVPGLLLECPLAAVSHVWRIYSLQAVPGLMAGMWRAWGLRRRGWGDWRAVLPATRTAVKQPALPAVAVCDRSPSAAMQPQVRPCPRAP